MVSGVWACEASQAEGRNSGTIAGRTGNQKLSFSWDCWAEGGCESRAFRSSHADSLSRDGQERAKQSRDGGRRQGWRMSLAHLDPAAREARNPDLFSCISQ